MKKEEKLFRITTKRKIMFDHIIRAINIRIDSRDEDSLARMLIEENDSLSPEEKKLKYAKLDEELKKLHLYHDVLETVVCHTDEWNRERFMMEKRDWNNEWDIPLPVFNESIEGTIDILEWFKMRDCKKQESSYNEQIAFLNMIKEFRNK